MKIFKKEKVNDLNLWFIKEIEYVCENTKCVIDNYIDFEKVCSNIGKKYNLEVVDAYISLKGRINGFFNGEEFFIPNSYGQEDGWEDNEFDFVILFKNKVIIRNKNGEIFQINFEYEINLDDFGGKRAFYLHNDLVRFRYDEKKYIKLPDYHKFKDGEDSLSGPHFTIRFN